MTTSDFEDSRAQLGGVEGFSYDTDDLLDGAELDEAMITPDGVARGDKGEKNSSRGMVPGMVGGQGGSASSSASGAGGTASGFGTGGTGTASSVPSTGINTSGLGNSTGLSSGGFGASSGINAGHAGISGIGSGGMGSGGASFSAGGAGVGPGGINPGSASFGATGASTHQAVSPQHSSYQPGAFLAGPVAATSFGGGGIDTDGDGIPDLFDYDPHTPGIQTRDGRTYTGPLPPGYVVPNPAITGPSGGIDVPSYSRYETPAGSIDSFYDSVSYPSLSLNDPSIPAEARGDWTSTTANSVGSVPPTYTAKPPADIGRSSVSAAPSNVGGSRGVTYPNAATSDMSVSTDSVEQAADEWRSWAEEMARINAAIERTRLQWDQYGFVYQPYSAYSSLHTATDKWTKEAEGSFADISGGLSNTSNSYSTTEQQSAASADSIQGMM